MRWLVVASVLCACHKPKPVTPVTAKMADAPYELADADDLAALRDRYDGLRRDQRAELRATLAAEYSRRAGLALERKAPDVAFEAFRRLVSLFDHPSDFAAAPAELERSLTLTRELRKVFAARGSDHETALTLFVLATIEPETAASSFAELDDMFAYSDELAVAGFGPGAERSRTLEVLESVVKVAPFPDATERLIELYRARHAAIDAIIRKGDLSYEVIGAHGQSVLVTAWNIIRVCALARRLEDAPAKLVDIDGFGDDPELQRSLAKALTSRSPRETIALASRFDEEEGKRDLDAALAILEWGLEERPGDKALLRTAGRFASRNSQVGRAIRLLKSGLAGPLDDRVSATELAELYEFRVTTLSLSGRPNAARKLLVEFETFYRRASKSWSDFTPDLANAYAAMGRGLLSLGDLDGAKKILDRSLTARTTMEALEHLGTLALRRDNFSLAANYFLKALELPAGDPSVRFNQAKLMRLAGEALRGAGRDLEADDVLIRALKEWRTLRSSDKFELRAPFAAEALVESGKVLWHLGKKDIALSAFAAAQDAAPGDANTYAAIVSFLVVRDGYDAALDAYHRALGSSEVSEYFKVYMSLWILAESRRVKRQVDPFVRDFLASRDGGLWYDHLARFASGRSSLAPLRKRATTRARQAELLYYKAVLGSPRRTKSARESLLRGVVESKMIMFFEYEMAKQWLLRGYSTP